MPVCSSYLIFYSKVFPGLSDDFFLLLGASLQLQVFEEELLSSVRILAGDNSELDGDDGQIYDPITQLHLNTAPDFMLCR